VNAASIALTVAMGLAINECCDLSPWAARKMVMWAARRRYVGNPERAEIRAIEQAALIDTRPGKIFKLLTACGFVSAELFCRLRILTGDLTSKMANRLPITREHMEQQVDDLRFFEREFRSRKSAYFDQMLNKLDDGPAAEGKLSDELVRQQIRDLEILEREVNARFRRYLYEQQQRLTRDPSRAVKRFVAFLPLPTRSKGRSPWLWSVIGLLDLIAFESQYRSRLSVYVADQLKAPGPAGTLTSLLDAGYGRNIAELEREYRRRLRLQITELRLLGEPPNSNAESRHVEDLSLQP
jgi:hypothetical protein